MHGDDFILPGFYDEILLYIRKFPNQALYATRTFYIDEKNIINGVSKRLQKLEYSSSEVSDFYYENPLQFAGVVVNKKAYLKYGYFDTDLSHVADYDMWVRLISRGGGVLSPKVLANYRIFDGNDTSKLEKTAKNVEENFLLHTKFSSTFRDYNVNLGRKIILAKTFRQIEKFRKEGNKIAELNNKKFYMTIATLKEQFSLIIRLIMKN